MILKKYPTYTPLESLPPDELLNCVIYYEDIIIILYNFSRTQFIKRMLQSEKQRDKKILKELKLI